MNDMLLISQVERFLESKGIKYVGPGMIGRRDNGMVEVIFTIPEALDPNVVVDPPDVRVWVNIDSGKIKIIPQM